MKKLIITTCVVLSMTVFPMSNSFAKCHYNKKGKLVGNCGGGAGSGGDVVNNINNTNRNVNTNTITNRNTNTNTNRNTNSQGQAQGQAQGQQQSIGDITVNVNGAEQVPAEKGDTIINEGDDNTTINNNAAEQKDLITENINMRGVRGFASAADISHVGIPSYFGPATKNANVQPADTMLMFKDTFTRAEVESYLKGTRVDHNREGEDIDAKYKTANQTIKVIMTPPARGTVIQTALITTSAETKDTESKDVLYTALMTGLDSGADLLLITAEGASTVMKSFGWGIGMSYTRATLSADETTGGVSAGGLGISGGKAGYKSLPWIQAIGLKLK